MQYSENPRSPNCSWLSGRFLPDGSRIGGPEYPGIRVIRSYPSSSSSRKLRKELLPNIVPVKYFHFRDSIAANVENEHSLFPIERDAAVAGP